LYCYSLVKYTKRTNVCNKTREILIFIVPLLIFGNGMEDLGFESKRAGPLWGPPNLLCNGYEGVLSTKVKRPGSEADNLPPSNVEVKNGWSYTSNPPISLHGVCRDNFIFFIFCV
jgi:hypothetical protein